MLLAFYYESKFIFWILRLRKDSKTLLKVPFETQEWRIADAHELVANCQGPRWWEDERRKFCMYTTTKKRKERSGR
jgi:hypothetical protein